MSAIIIAMQPVRTARSYVQNANNFAGIGERIVAARRAKGMRPTDLAAHMGIGTNTIAMWETGARRPNIENAALLKAILGIPSDWLFFGDDSGLDWQTREKIVEELARISDERAAAPSPSPTREPTAAKRSPLKFTG